MFLYVLIIFFVSFNWRNRLYSSLYLRKQRKTKASRNVFVFSSRRLVARCKLVQANRTRIKVRNDVRWRGSTKDNSKRFRNPPCYWIRSIKLLTDSNNAGKAGCQPRTARRTSVPESRASADSRFASRRAGIIPPGPTGETTEPAGLLWIARRSCPANNPVRYIDRISRAASSRSCTLASCLPDYATDKRNWTNAEYNHPFTARLLKPTDFFRRVFPSSLCGDRRSCSFNEITRQTFNFLRLNFRRKKCGKVRNNGIRINILASNREHRVKVTWRDLHDAANSPKSSKFLLTLVRSPLPIG